ncbi:hypothetical protein [Pararobbsia silviterrae]|uniref:Peptide-binding protein n=1 Tax=Pararobbsia silviterrae TaxID=1792498 RepID=A0A494XHL0_9BURK|nr:hypothetical protein [Pararobbsia silviterrae]RKP50237.1 hypothetical protein D7S86_19100 [Pararobbsia silviterrae]
MIAKALLAVGAAALGLGGFLMAAPARSQAASAIWAAHGAPVALPVDRAPPASSTFTPPAPRGNLRGDIAANSREDRHDHDRDHRESERKSSRQ